MPAAATKSKKKTKSPFERVTFVRRDGIVVSFPHKPKKSRGAKGCLAQFGPKGKTPNPAMLAQCLSWTKMSKNAK